MSYRKVLYNVEKGYFLIIFFENVNLNFYHQKPETNLENDMSMKKFKQWCVVIFHQKGHKKGFLKILFSETLTETITIKNLKHL